VQNSDVSSTSIFSHFQTLKAVCLSNKTKDGVSDGFPVSPTQKNELQLQVSQIPMARLVCKGT
jgi:hypothetical protein